MRFTQKQKRNHYRGVAKGVIPVKQKSKYSAVEQIAYARGQADARNESVRICAYKNASPMERESYKTKKMTERKKYKENKKRVIFL